MEPLYLLIKRILETSTPNAAASEARTGINALAHAPHGQPVAVPFGYAAARLHRNRNSPSEAVGELFDDVRFRKPLLDIAALIRPSGMRKVLGRIRVPDQISVAMAQIGRIRSHRVLQRRSEGQNLVLHLDGVGGILSKILGFGHHDGHDFPLQIQFPRHRFRQYPASRDVGTHQLRRILVREDVVYARHLLSGRSVDVHDAGVRVRRGQEPRIEQIAEPYAARVLRFAGEPRNGNLGQRRQRLAHHFEVFRWIPLPLLRDRPAGALHHFIARQVSAGGRVVPHHRHLDLNDRIRFGLDSDLASSHHGGRIHHCRG